VEKIEALEKELSETIGEKHRVKKELKETKDAMNEFRAAIAKLKLEAKKSFYKGIAEES
jgi:chaperonin cofactor prefoldin